MTYLSDALKSGAQMAALMAIIALTPLKGLVSAIAVLSSDASLFITVILLLGIPLMGFGGLLLVRGGGKPLRQHAAELVGFWVGLLGSAHVLQTYFLGGR